MNTDSMEAFVAFAESSCNLTVAGRAVGLSQPAMHARLQGLARDVDVALYERRGRRLALTADGTRVLAWAKDVLERERLLRAELKGAAADDRLVLACGEGALVHVVADRLAPWVREHPGILSFSVVDGFTAVEAVRRGDAHAAVVAGPATQAADLRTESLVTTSLCAVAPRGHAIVKDNAVDIERLLLHPLLVPPVGRPLRTTLEEAAAARNMRVQVAAEVTGWEAVARLSRLAVGVGIVNDVVKTPGLARASIRGLPSTTYRAVTRRGRQLPSVQTLLQALTTPHRPFA